MYAIIETGGKQFKVQEGDVIKVEKLDVAPGENVEITRVLAVIKDDEVIVGRPVIEGAKAVLKVMDHGKAEKILIFKYKPKKNYRKMQGHRQPYSQVLVEKIII